MQTIPLCDLTVSFDEGRNDFEDFEDKKTALENTCKQLQKFLKKMNKPLKPVCAAIDSNSDRKLTVAVVDGEIRLGIYRQSVKKIETECRIEDLGDFSVPSIESLETRLMFILKESKGEIPPGLSYINVQEAWDDLFEKQKANLEESLRHISGKYNLPLNDLVPTRDENGQFVIIYERTNVVIAELDGYRNVKKDPNERYFLDEIDVDTLVELFVKRYPDSDVRCLKVNPDLTLCYKGQIVNIFDKDTDLFKSPYANSSEDLDDLADDYGDDSEDYEDYDEDEPSRDDDDLGLGD